MRLVDYSGDMQAAANELWLVKKTDHTLENRK